jgi:GT2 family glycosyltransferase
MKEVINIVLLCYNALPYTKATLRSLKKTVYSPFVLTIIDNKSTDGSRTFLRKIKHRRFSKCCKKIYLIENEKNLGPGLADNQGFEISLKIGAKYTILCNNDLYFSDGWLENLIQKLVTDSKLAMVNPLRPASNVWFNRKAKITTIDRLKTMKICRSWHTELKSFTGLPVRRFNEFSQKIIEQNRLPNRRETENIAFPNALSSCVCAVNTALIKKVGGVSDPRFTHYGGEDIDLSWRIMQAGYKCGIAHDTYVHHFRGKSIDSLSANREVLIRNSNQILYNKWRTKIKEYLLSKVRQGVKPENILKGSDSGQYWLIRQLNQTENILTDFRSSRRTRG